MTALAAVGLVHSQNQTIATWFSTAFIREESFATHTVRYGNTPVTPVPTTTEPIILITSVLTEPTASRNINSTTWHTTQVTVPVATRLVTVQTTPPAPPTITLPGTATTTVRVTPTIATVTFSPAFCANGTTPLATVTKYTGTYSPFPGQPSAVPTIFPTAVTTYFRATYHYKVYPYTGTTATFTSTVTKTTYLSTTTVGTTTVNLMGGTRGYTRTSYATTVTATVGVYQLANASRTVDSCEATRTVTYHAKCAPTNLIAEREGRGIGIRPVGWMDWTAGFPLSTEVDASGCCQLCVANEGCAASEWRSPKSYTKARCLLYYWNHGEQNGNGTGKGTCGGDGTGLEYFGDANALPRLGSFVQNGCGEVKYVGGYDSLCPKCKVD